jgi:transposase-like protein
VSVAESSSCPSCTSSNTACKASVTRIGLTIHECRQCGAQFTLQNKRRDPLRPRASRQRRSYPA